MLRRRRELDVVGPGVRGAGELGDGQRRRGLTRTDLPGGHREAGAGERERGSDPCVPPLPPVPVAPPVPVVPPVPVAPAGARGAAGARCRRRCPSSRRCPSVPPQARLESAKVAEGPGRQRHGRDRLTRVELVGSSRRRRSPARVAALVTCTVMVLALGSTVAEAPEAL